MFAGLRGNTLTSLKVKTAGWIFKGVSSHFGCRRASKFYNLAGDPESSPPSRTTTGTSAKSLNRPVWRREQWNQWTREATGNGDKKWGKQMTPNVPSSDRSVGAAAREGASEWPGIIAVMDRLYPPRALNPCNNTTRWLCRSATLWKNSVRSSANCLCSHCAAAAEEAAAHAQLIKQKWGIRWEVPGFGFASDYWRFIVKVLKFDDLFFLFVFF